MLAHKPTLLRPSGSEEAFLVKIKDSSVQLMSSHKGFHTALATRQISKRVAKAERETVKYAKDTVFGYVYQELKKQTRAKT